MFDRISYRECWLQHTGIDLPDASCEDLINLLSAASVAIPETIVGNFDALQDLVMGTVIADAMPANQYSCIYNYPASQASLARIDKSDHNWPVASRFEIYYGAVELANGFHELSDGAEQLARFESDNQVRQKENKPVMPVDNRFIASLDEGLPDCAGVAIGIDRLMMVLLKDVQALQDVISFDWQRA